MDAYDHRRRGPSGEFAEIAKTVIYALVIAFVIRVLAFQPFTIPSASMEPTLFQGDYIIVFKLPRDPHMDYIKRLIGLPGDKVQIKHGTVFINDKPIPQKPAGTTTIDLGGFQQKADRLIETMPNGKTYTTYQVNPDDPAENTDVYQVPKGEYFFMGDNRDNSLDSRFPPENDGVGFVPAENLEGKAQLILLSWGKGASLFKPWTWVLNTRPSRFFNSLLGHPGPPRPPRSKGAWA